MSRKNSRKKSMPSCVDQYKNELMREISVLTNKHPELSEPDNIKNILGMITDQVGIHSKQANNNRLIAKLTSTVATSLSGAVAVGLLAYIVLPNLPGMTMLGSLAGLLCSKFAATKIDEIADNIHSKRHPTSR
ncbi:hypothetical protein [Fundidesulfovibrio magnetotacticus]|uniref:hypothetical protein n=1 Tax=Fundidesulfovibrio magnetotacticus TaxID=2730080 RepID=UPI001566F69C|nr:hypothetical protein [Fundidesulfovibrio magnetotacticus]